MVAILRAQIVSLAITVLGIVTIPSSFAVPPLKIAVLDVDKVLHDAAVSKHIQVVGEETRKKMESDVQEFEKGLRIEESKLKELQNKNAPEFSDEQKKFEEKVVGVQKKLSGRTKILEEAFAKARSQVIQKIMAIVERMASENKITLVIPKNVVLYREDEYEITEQVLKTLDKEMPSVEIALPK